MKFGRTLTELAAELERQQNAKHDYVLDTRNMRMDSDEDSPLLLTITNEAKKESIILKVNEVAHDQLGQNLGIPAKYYNKMRYEYPKLLAANVNGWLHSQPQRRMLRTLDGTARAFLSDRYRRIDNYEIAQAVLPIIGNMPEATIESCQITDERLYIKVVNPRLTTEVVPGDIVQSGMMITNSEVGLGSLTIQPLVYRLVCKNGMVVNDARIRKYHAGRTHVPMEDFTVYSDATMKADDKAFIMKVQDTVKAVVDQTKFEAVVNKMRGAKNEKLVSDNIPGFVELAGTEFGFGKKEGESILNYLIRGGDLSLYGFANSITRAAQDVESYDRSTVLETIGYDVLSMSPKKWSNLNAAATEKAAA